jgi:uncharacterized RDD family membrane protein YckC
VSEASSSAPADVVPAGFVRRWAAFFIDSLVLAAGFYGVFFIALFGVAGAGGLEALGNDEPPLWLVGLQLGLAVLYLVAAGLYYSLMESSRSQATLGKMALSIKVVDMDGRRLSFAHALGRWASASLSYITLYIGFLMAAFTERKQALHDLVARTQVVDQWAYTDFPERQSRRLSGCLVVFLLGVMLIPIFAILAAIAIPAYQDYMERAKLANVLRSADPVKLEVALYAEAQDACPSHDTTGFGAPTSYAGVGVRQIRLHTGDDGRCAVIIDLEGYDAIGADQRWIELQLDRRSGQWSCRSGLPDRMLPASCRG